MTSCIDEVRHVDRIEGEVICRTPGQCSINIIPQTYGRSASIPGPGSIRHFWIAESLLNMNLVLIEISLPENVTKIWSTLTLKMVVELNFQSS